MIAPGTYCAKPRRLALPLVRLSPDHDPEPIYPERVAHYRELLDAHPEHDIGIIMVTPDPRAPGLYTILDGRHRYLASRAAQRADILAVILIAPDQPEYADFGAA